MQTIDTFHAYIRKKTLAIYFTWGTRILLALGFLPSGMIKLLGKRFTQLPIDNPIGFFFEGLYLTGWYWNFLGLSQLMAAALIVIPRTTFFGALVYFPIILNIFLMVTSMHFTGTPIVTGLMLLANIYLLCWDWTKLKALMRLIFAKDISRVVH